MNEAVSATVIKSSVFLYAIGVSLAIEKGVNGV
jgi:hypothetical protein